MQKWRHSQDYTFLAAFLEGGGNLSVCKLQCELVATAALFAHLHVVRAKILSFFFDYRVKLCTQVASTAHSLCCGTFTLCFTCRVFACLHPERAISRRTERELGSSPQLFSARGINKSARFFSLGSGYQFLHKVMFVLLLKFKVVSKLQKYLAWHSFYLKPDVLHGN